MSEDYRPRLSAELTQEQADILNKILPHGMKKPLFQAIINGVIEIYEHGGLEALGAIQARYISIGQVSTIGLTRTKEDQIKSLRRKLKELLDGHNI